MKKATINIHHLNMNQQDIMLIDAPGPLYQNITGAAR
jgi:hypothetical protein